MSVNNNLPPLRETFIDPVYLKGEFFEKSTGSLDAAFKVAQLKSLWLRNIQVLPQVISRVADVGCGTGTTTVLLQEMWEGICVSMPIVHGYDVHPYVREFNNRDRLKFFAGDFRVIADSLYDLVVLFDVIEHVPDPIEFIRAISQHTRLMAFHIPLDDALFSWFRHLPRHNLFHPGHLVVLDVPSALNLITFSGLRILDFEYSPGFRAPSGQATTFQKLLFPFRVGLYKLSPYLTQKLLAGVSLTVLAWTAKGLSEATIPEKI